MTGQTFTYVSTTSFTVTGDQTDIYKQYRRVKGNLSGSTVYSEVVSSSYDGGNLTTVTILDAVLNNTLVSVEHSIALPAKNNGAITLDMVAPDQTGKDGKAMVSSGGKSTWGDNRVLLAYSPAHYERDIKWSQKGTSVAADRYTLRSPNVMSVNINNVGYALTAQTDIDLSVAANWDTTTPTDYTVAANRAGKDFYVYACQPGSGTVPTLKLSANSTVPSGYTADNSRKIGGFHCLCVAVGTISGHTLTGFVAGDILPASIWDLKHKPKFANPEGMVFSQAANLWVDIYLASGTGTNTKSAYGATISDTRNWMDFVDDGGAVSKRLLTDTEFQLIAAGSNEETNITGSADPVTAGGHSDTAARRMISNIGCEDCCGVMWQWLLDQTYYPYGSTGYWGNLPGGKGSIYTSFQADPGSPEVDNSDNGGDIKLLAGG
ncbi:MAG: hypothetical protein AB1553_16310, partial [Nitrospirota bacterium]